ncbi:MAG: hypothetical protein KIT84_09145 [Labilithrix sp.]|nr:hypothetical protein [Labilithrix sp.]MCW5811166.1 hypothetical protein [Labilithrix sp.]
MARRLRERDDVPFRDPFLDSDAALVPVPRSGLLAEGALWPALEIARELRAWDFGSQVLPCLERTMAVAKAATSVAEARPKARTHLESLIVVEPLSLPARVTLVDDVVTRGAQLFGAAWAIWSVRPDVEIRAFAAVRTVSDASDFIALAEPCSGRIEWRDEECRRRP